jgi:phosphoenolpyruvate carboxykinase (GTP)
MDAQFQFFNSDLLAAEKKPILAGLNYFLTHGARGGAGKKLLGEKKDVKVWLAWLERRAHGDVDAIDTPIGYLPLYEDLRSLFQTRIQKEYSLDIYTKQFSLYIDNIVARINLQIEAYGREENLPARLFEVLNSQKEGLMSLRAAHGPIVTPDQLQASV